MSHLPEDDRSHIAPRPALDRRSFLQLAALSLAACAMPRPRASARPLGRPTPTPAQLRWQRDVRSRYGWLSWLGALGFFWLTIGALLAGLVVLRRRRDRAKRQLLDELEITE